LGRRRTRTKQTLSFAVIGMIVLIAAAAEFIKNYWFIFIGIAVVIVGIIIYLFINKNRKRGALLTNELTSEIINRLPSDALHHLNQALNLELAQDFLGSRMHYMQCMECMRDLKETQEYEVIGKQYENFVSRDPVFHKLAEGLIKGIKLNPGILQSEITKQLEPAENWGVLQYYNRKISRDDIYYALYFMDKLGYITRAKKGRSYELYPKEDAVFRIQE
jgi:general stress protein CsbA